MCKVNSYVSLDNFETIDTWVPTILFECNLKSIGLT